MLSAEQIEYGATPKVSEDELSTSRCPHASETRPVFQRSDEEVLANVTEWMTRRLQCIAGRREFKRGRYMLRIATKESVVEIVDEYRSKLARGETVACLLIFNDSRFYEGQSDTSHAFRFLAEQMAGISSLCPRKLASGASLTHMFELRCPVTNELVLYDDFECIAFCPQSSDTADRLYDPLMYAPYPCVNMSSDVFGFSRFVSDSARASLGKEVFEEDDVDAIARLFEHCIERWQRVAVSTIQNFEKATDTSLCPVHVTKEGTHWIAAHKDPAFAEQKKEVHRHELPVLYARRITDRWLRFFRGGEKYDAAGMARDGVPA